MIWGSMAWNGCGNLEFIEGIMNKERYLDIVKRNVAASARKLSLSRRYKFQQDSDPKHTAKIVSAWFKEKKIKVLDWCPQSPDLNPIEHLWAHLKIKVREQNPRNIHDLKEVVQQEWDKIDAEVTNRLVESMNRRCQAVIDAKGGHINY